MKKLLVILAVILLMSCAQTEKLSPTIEDLEPYFVFAEDDGALIGVISHRNITISNDSLFCDDIYIGKYKGE